MCIRVYSPSPASITVAGRRVDATHICGDTHESAVGVAGLSSKTEGIQRARLASRWVTIETCIAYTHACIVGSYKSGAAVGWAYR